MDSAHQKLARRRTILVSGASRGVGAATARKLASPTSHVVITYREKAARANNVVDDITAAGGSASAVRVDICDPTACDGVIDYIAGTFGHLDALILNASGGLERGADPDYPNRINRDAPVHLARLALPLFPAGGRAVVCRSPSGIRRRGFAGLAGGGCNTGVGGRGQLGFDLDGEGLDLFEQGSSRACSLPRTEWLAETRLRFV